MVCSKKLRHGYVPATRLDIAAKLACKARLELAEIYSAVIRSHAELCRATPEANIPAITHAARIIPWNVQLLRPETLIEGSMSMRRHAYGVTTFGSIILAPLIILTELPR